MESIDFIYTQIYKGSLSAKATERSAHNAAIVGVSEYKKGRFKKVSNLIQHMIKQAKKNNL